MLRKSTQHHSNRNNSRDSRGKSYIMMKLKIIGYKNGIYLVYRPGAYTDANGHVSLWLKREMNTIDNPDTGVIGELCFWELT